MKGCSLFAIQLEITLYVTLQTLMGRKSVTLFGYAHFGISIRFECTMVVGIYPEKMNFLTSAIKEGPNSN